jgi:hypothetical protein
MINGEWTHESHGLLSSVGNELAKEIDDVRVRLKRTNDDIIGIGQSLMKIKSTVEHGQFVPLLKIEFDMSEDTAQNFMRVARRFGDEKNRNFRFLPSSVLYELSKPSIPNEIVDATLDAIQDGTLPPSVKAVHEAVLHGIPEEVKPIEVLHLENEQEQPQDAQRKPEHKVVKSRDFAITERMWGLLKHPDFDLIGGKTLDKWMQHLDSDTYQVMQERLTKLEELVIRLKKTMNR